MYKISIIAFGVLLTTNAYATDVSTVDELFDAFSKGEDVVLTDNISVTDENYWGEINSGVIDGNDKIITGTERGDMFIRNMGGGIGEIKDLTIDGFKNKILEDDGDDNQGGAFTNMGTVDTINNVVFQNNEAGNGGAIDNGYGAYIGSINAKFISNGAWGHGESSGGAIFNQGRIGNIEGYFEDNVVGLHGAIWNHGTIDNITATFYQNHRSAVGATNGSVTIRKSKFLENDSTGIDGVGQSGGGVHFYGGAKFYIYDSEFDKNSVWWKGGAIAAYGGSSNVLVVENSKFTNNSSGEEGGAIYYASKAGATGNVKNSTFTNNSGRTGAAIYNSASTFSISESTFDGNKDHASWSNGGGAVANGGVMDISSSEFQNNASVVKGGAISNFGGELSVTSSNIEKNTATSYGGGIYVKDSTVTITDTNIKENKAKQGGGLYVVDTSLLPASLSEEHTVVPDETVSTASDDFIAKVSGNEVEPQKLESVGTEILIEGGEISSNTATGEGGGAYITTGNVVFKNVDILDNVSGSGGAVHALTDVGMLADGEDMYVSGNNADTNNVGVYVDEAVLSLGTQNDGRLIFEDVVDGNEYDVTIVGDTTNYDELTAESKGYIDFRNDVNNVNTLTLAEGGLLHLSKDESMNVKNLKGQNGALLLEAEMDAQTNTLTNGVINVSEDVEGTSNVVVNFLKDDTSTAPTDVLSPFVVADNDDMSTDASFNVARVMGSPYMWESKYNVNGDEVGSVWYLGIKENTDDSGDTVNPSIPVNPEYTPEVGAYVGMQYVTVEQNRALATGVLNGLNVFDNRMSSLSCNGKEPCTRSNLWIHTGYEGADIDAPVEIDAEIKNVTAGVDLYRDNASRFGIFGSYRDGKYDFSGKGDYYSINGSEIDIESYVGGAYYKLDKNNWALFTTLFAGKQDMDITTDDNYVNASTDAMQYGGSAELIRRFVISKYLDLEPSLGIYYTMIDIDDFSDGYGKNVEFDVLHYWEAELGMKINYAFCCNGCSNRWYVKPSVIRTFSNGGETKITGLNNVKSYKDRTLGRLEIGGEFGITSRLSGYTSGGYTFGSDYKTYDVLMGLNYKL